MLNIGSMKSGADEAFKTQVKEARWYMLYIGNNTEKSLVKVTWTIEVVNNMYILCLQHKAVLIVVGLLANYWIKKLKLVPGLTHLQEQNFKILSRSLST